MNTENKLVLFLYLLFLFLFLLPFLHGWIDAWRWRCSAIDRQYRLARRVKASPPSLIGRWLRRRAASALLDGSVLGMDAVIEALPNWSGAERDWLLKEIAARASPGARDAVCAAWAKSRDAALGRIIAEHGLVASAPPALTVLTALHGGQFEQLRILGADDVSALLEATTDRDPELAQRARKVLAGVERLEDREIVCEHFFRHDDPDIGAMLVAWAYVPKEAARQALLFFLTGQWRRYEDIDVDHGLLRVAYEAADAAQRHRIMDQASRHGRQEWVGAAVGGLSGKRLGQMSKAEWETVLQVLSATQNYRELWRLAQEAPPRWARRLLDALGDWPLQQASEPDRAELARLLQCVAACPLEVPLGALTEETLTEESDIRPGYRHRNPTVALSISPDATLLASINEYNATVRLWRLPDGASLATLTGHTGSGQCLAISPDGTLLASGSDDATVRLWRLPDGAPLATLQGHRYYVSDVAMSPDGTLLASTGGDHTVRLWRLPDGALLTTLREFGYRPHLVISRDNTLLAAGHKLGVHLWRLADGALLASLTARDPLAISPDGTLLASASGSYDGIVHLWRLPRGTPLAALTGHTGWVNCLAISPDGTLLASGGADGTVRLWRLPDGTPRGTLKGHARGVFALAVSADGTLLASGGEDACVRLWRLPDGVPLASVRMHPRCIFRLAMSPDGTLLAIGGYENTVQVWFSPLPSLAALPVGAIDAVRQAWLSEQLQSPRASPEERRWLEFIAALIRWRRRYDIGLAVAPSQGPGEFDIGLGT